MEASDRVAVLPAVDLGQVAQRTPGSHEALLRTQLRQPRAGELLADVAAQSLQFLGPWRIGAKERVGEAQRAERKTVRAPQPSALKERDLHAAAAHVEEDAVLHGQAAHSAEKAVVRFLLA